MAFPVKDVYGDFQVEIEVNGITRAFRIPRAHTEEWIKKGDVLVLWIMRMPSLTTISPYAFRHPQETTYYKL